jgi:phosphomannomutase
VVVGGDIRETSEALKMALSRGLRDGGVDVIDIGMVGTEEIYFATVHLGVDGGVEVTASHNPIDYNGLKLVREGSRPISGDTGLKEMQRIAEVQEWPAEVAVRGSYRQQDLKDAYAQKMLSYIDAGALKPLKLVVNAGNGAAGPALDAIERQLQAIGAPIEFIKVHHEPDAGFPHGIPNPILPENRAQTADVVIAEAADMGIAWDGDFDRCFLFDENGQFIEGVERAELARQQLRCRRAEVFHTERGEQARQRTGLRLGDCRNQLLGAGTGEPFEGHQLLRGEHVDVGRIGHQAVRRELHHGSLTETLDVHRTT